MCLESVHIPSRDAKAKEHLKLSMINSAHIVPVPAKAEKGPHKMVCIRKETKCVVRKLELTGQIITSLKTYHADSNNRKVLALHGKRNVQALINRWSQIIVMKDNRRYATVYWGWLKEGTLIDIGYPVRRKPKVKAIKKVEITGDAGVEAIRKAVKEATSVPRVVARGKAKPKKRVKAKS